MTYAKRFKALMLGLAVAASIPAMAATEPVITGRPVEHQLNMQAPVTGIAAYIYSLHNWMMVVCLVIFIGVFGVMFYSVFKHRKSLGHKPATFHESTTVEIAWTVIPFLIVIGMALPATHAVVQMKDTSNPDLTIKVTGMQWKWGYDYLKGEGEGISFLSNLATPRTQVGEPGIAPTEKRTENYLLEVDNPVVVPVGKKVRLVLTANDVIHSWTIPAFAVKQDAIPGFVRDTWFKAEQIGTYRGNCVELCGKEHAFMPIVVKVVSAEDYTAWVNGEKTRMAALADDPNKVWTIDELKTKGEKVYAANCVACHQANGQGVPSAFAALVGSPVVLGPKAEQIAVLLNGKHSGKYPSAMPAWKQLSDSEIASVITYTRNNWTNKADENIVQPSEVLAARGK
ncbi:MULTISPECIES: cytochrome c oxidase subunit II [Massilia]|jgi:cytochrome c oxidase subunit 2|uniref:Cytochrome c oxidase subunit 2 n=2 Tax=Massilia TaxID=149698 RepID=A0A7X3G1R9_9BURK|nr:MULTISPECIES: cytochrome c oxidase subunit II [Telluria group]KQY18761.1 cytochrome C oxidase subunit II [Massilia sp. Root133]KQZ53686.1 cytochrome C oxidase subunit II [Massilia sp. Root1485]MDN4041539.1 cytochrome c oxidase subunit II [Massilia sp. YIM B02787]MVW61885.1 cytochrome c oxidase subunit II [Telluria cellulosilytica]